MDKNSEPPVSVEPDILEEPGSIVVAKLEPEPEPDIAVKPEPEPESVIVA